MQLTVIDQLRSYIPVLGIELQKSIHDGTRTPWYKVDPVVSLQNGFNQSRFFVAIN